MQKLPPLRLGIAGLGTVGIGVVKIIQNHQELLTKRTGRRIEITAVCARDQQKDRGVDLSNYAWETSAENLAKRDDIDVFVELMGGHKGAAKQATEAAISSKKHVVTANKALLAHHGQALALAAEAQHLSLRFEAAVAGGIPVIKALGEGLAGNKVTRVMGVMNGTCNYILTQMQATGRGYNALFQECGDLGYLEADPQLDVGGIDAGHKLALLSSLAFGTRVNFDAVELEGIEHIQLADIDHAAELGYRIKLLGVSQMTERGLEQRMSPCLVPVNSPLGQLEGGTNMVVIDGDAVEQIVLRGPGAGEGPTASAVMADITDIARNFYMPVFGQPAQDLLPVQSVKVTKPAPYYLRLCLLDKPGALAKVAGVLGDAGISIDRMRQTNHQDTLAPVLIVTHHCSRDDLDIALAQMSKTNVIEGTPIAIRIEGASV